MMEGGNPELLLRLVVATEKSAFAQEELIRLATEERDGQEQPVEMPGLPICPHCGTLNPTIRNEGGRGPFGDFALLAICDTCQHTFIAEPQGWSVYKDKQEYEGREVNDNGTRSDP
jgi:hypothetical protein